MGIPIPLNLQLPQDAESKPFKLDGMFLVEDGKLIATEIGGKKVVADDSMQHEQAEYSDTETSEDSSEGEGECGCDSMGNGESETCSECGKKKMGGANTFVLAIERALAKR